MNRLDSSDWLGDLCSHLVSLVTAHLNVAAAAWTINKWPTRLPHLASVCPFIHVRPFIVSQPASQSVGQFDQQAIGRGSGESERGADLMASGPIASPRDRDRWHRARQLVRPQLLLPALTFSISLSLSIRLTNGTTTRRQEALVWAGK